MNRNVLPAIVTTNGHSNVHNQTSKKPGIDTDNKENGKPSDSPFVGVSSKEVTMTSPQKQEPEDLQSPTTLTSVTKDLIKPVSDKDDVPTKTALQMLSENSEAFESFAKVGSSPLKTGDIIAFKVFTPSLEISDNIIALIDEVHISDDNPGLDFDITMEIMGN